LTREHGDLAAVMGIVGYQVADEGGGIGFEAFDADSGFEGFGDEFAESRGAGFEARDGFFDGDGGFVERRWDGAAGGFEPHAVDAVDMGGERGDVAALASGRSGAPGGGVEVFEEIDGDAGVDIEGLKNRGGAKEWIDFALGFGRRSNRGRLRRGGCHSGGSLA